jgi:DNA repair protein RecO
MSITDHAICLRRSDYSETSLVVRFMTRLHGQVATIAKGVKRPKSKFGGSIDLLTVGQAVFTLPREGSSGTMGLLMAWDQTDVFPCLRTDLLRHAAATTAGELLGRLIEELDPHPASFDAMLTFLRALQADQPPIRRLAEFMRSLLLDVGLTPNVDACVNCGRLIEQEAQPPAKPPAPGSSPGRVSAAPRPDKLVFSGPRSGPLCPACQPRPGESTLLISRKIKESFIQGELTSGRLALDIVRWLVYHVQHQIGRELTSAAALERAVEAALAKFAASSRENGK